MADDNQATCPTCHHDAHPPGYCDRDNCGEDELILPPRGWRPSILDGDNAYVAGMLYDRKGQLRKRARVRQGRANDG